MLASLCTDSVQAASFAQFAMSSHDGVVSVVITCSTAASVWPSTEEKGGVVNAYDTAILRRDRMSLAPDKEPEGVTCLGG